VGRYLNLAHGVFFNAVFHGAKVRRNKIHKLVPCGILAVP
jgi:hypothetical protein